MASAKQSSPHTSGKHEYSPSSVLPRDDSPDGIVGKGQQVEHGNRNKNVEGLDYAELDLKHGNFNTSVIIKNSANKTVYSEVKVI